MKIVNIIGGLGNQMFQYALAIALRQYYPDDKILVDRSHFNRYKLHNGFEIDRIFGQTIPTATVRDLIKVSYYVPWYKLSRVLRRILPRRASEFIEKSDYIFDDSVFHVVGDCYYEGYWQSAKYFEKCRDLIMAAFTFPRFTDAQNIETAEEMLLPNSVAVHVRRGDYVNAPNYTGICGIEYYSHAIAEINKRIDSPHYFIFSNDIQWCKDNISPLIANSQITFVSNNQGEDSYRDMQLMSLARACILANSSFSWWGAYLNKRDDRLIIVPDRWVNSKESDDIYLNEWIKVK